MNDMNGYVELNEAERLAGIPNCGSDDGRTWPEPLPLIRPLAEPEPYPVEALGAVLSNAASGIADLVQCPVAIACCSVLAVASLAAQAHVDVMHPATGRPVPSSLFLLTVAESGERKSAANSEALAPVRQREHLAVENYRRDFSRWKNSTEAWEASRAAIKRKAKGDWHELERMLAELGDEPKPPLKPHLTVSEPTYEALAKLLAEGQPSLGLFSAEGGGFIGGHSMRDENRLRALTGLSELWDGSPLKRTRAGDGAIHLAGRRLAVHLMVQPGVAPLLLADEMAMGQGFLSRLLVCAPASLQGKRFQREPQQWSRPAISAYSDLISNLLSQKPRTLGSGELDPVCLPLSTEAAALWRGFADDMERSLLVEGQVSGIRGLRNKIPEMALRIAGVLSAVESRSEIDAGTFQRAIALALFHLSEAKRLYEASMTSPEIARAGRLLRWLVERKVATISLRDIQVTGPTALRQQDAVQQAVKVLTTHHLGRVEVVETGGRPSNVLSLSPYAQDAIF